MRYIDTGSRDQEQALGTWLQEVMASRAVAELRLQSGFFNHEPLGLFAPTFRRLAQANGIAYVLIGSNPPGTLRDDVLRLVHMMCLPRTHARLGVVQYGNAFYHPKVYHFRHDDGSQCAYVGSANLTGPGVASRHVEAGVALDTLEDDPVNILDQIASAIDAWFDDNRAGMRLIDNDADVQQLVSDGVLIASARPIVIEEVEDEGQSDADATVSPRSSASPRLRALVRLPQFRSPQQRPPRTQTRPASTPARRWWKQLTKSDAMRKPKTSHQRNYVILGKAGHDIDQKTWFRNDLFAPATWTSETMRTGNVKEVANIRMDIFVNTTKRGTFFVRFDHAPNRIAHQNNAPTWLNWSGLIELIRSHDFTNWWLVLERFDPNTYRLTLSQTEPH